MTCVSVDTRFRHSSNITLSHPHIGGYSMDGYNMNWLTTMHTDTNTAVVYPVCVWDRTSTMNAICVDACMRELAIYDWWCLIT